MWPADLARTACWSDPLGSDLRFGAASGGLLGLIPPAGRTYPVNRARARYRFANPSVTKLRLAFFSSPR